MRDEANPDPPTFADALALRYGRDPGLALPPLGPESETVLRSLIGHRSWRAFRNEALPAGALELAIAVAQSASNSSNLQSWSVVAVSDPQRRAALNALAGRQRHIDEAPLLLVWLADLGKLRDIARSVGSAAEALDHLEMLLSGTIDAALAAQAAVSALEAQGLGACFIGAIRNRADLVAAELGLPSEVFPVFGLAVGMPDHGRPARVKPRLPQSAVLHHDRYVASAPLAPVAGYNGTMRRFQRAEGLPPSDWTQSVARRVADPKVLTGRENLVDYLIRMGFGLK